MRKSRISIIAAVDRNRVIGKAGKMPWHLPADLVHFKQKTVGHPIIMGRKTFESIGKVLPGRTNIVITKNNSDEFSRLIGIIVAKDIKDAIKIAKKSPGSEEIFVIGGESIYNEAIKIADKMYLTEIDGEFIGDKFFPKFEEENWREAERGFRVRDKQNSHNICLVIYERERKKK